MRNRGPRSILLGVVFLALASPAGAQAARLPSKPKPKQYILVEAGTTNSTKFFEYTKTKTWELPEEGITGTYTKKRKGDQFEIV